MANILSENSNKLLERLKETAILNRRMHIRYEVEKEIQYVMKERVGQSFKGLIVNISDSGMGLFVFNPLHEGQEITIKSDEKSLNRQGIVRRCHEMGEKIYKVGLEFIIR